MAVVILVAIVGGQSRRAVVASLSADQRKILKAKKRAFSPFAQEIAQGASPDVDIAGKAPTTQPRHHLVRCYTRVAELFELLLA